MGARRQAEDGSARARGRIRTARTRPRRADGRGRRRRRTHPADAHRRSQRRVEGASGRAAAHDPARADRNRRHVLPHRPRRHGRGLRRLHAAHQEADAGTRPQSQFSRDLAAGVRAARRRTVSRRPSRKCARSSISSSRHRNITGGTSFHTWSGVLLRPFEHQPDEEMHAEDLWVYQAAGQQGHRAHRLSGTSRSTTSSAITRSQVIGGTFDWVYEHLGIFSWVVEIWSPDARSGASPATSTSTGSATTRRTTTSSSSAGATSALGGLAHVPWKPFDHPQLGKVEIGGWNRFHAFSNPPPQLPRARARALSEVARVAGARLAEARARACGGEGGRRRQLRRSRSSCRTRAGCRRTSSKRALERKIVRGLVAEIALPADATLIEGKRREEHGQLEGKRVQAHRRLVLARLPRHRRPHEARVGRARQGRRRGRRSPRGTSAPAPSAPT